MAAAPTNPEDSVPIDTATARDRRRPGRPDNVSPELLPLLRGQLNAQLQAQAALDHIVFGNPDQTRAATGIVVSLAISGAMWLAIIRVAQHLL